MRLSLITALFVVMVVMVPRTKAVTCYNCDSSCPAKPDSTTATCTGICVLEYMHDNGERVYSCDEATSNGTKFSCTPSTTNGRKTTKCVCNSKDFCTDKDCLICGGIPAVNSASYKCYSCDSKCPAKPDNTTDTCTGTCVLDYDNGERVYSCVTATPGGTVRSCTTSTTNGRKTAKCMCTGSFCTDAECVCITDGASLLSVPSWIYVLITAATLMYATEWARG